MKKLFLLTLSIFILTSCTKDDLTIVEIIENNNNIPDDIIDDTTNDTEDVYEPTSGIFVNKNSNFLDYSYGIEQTFYGGNGKGYFKIGNEEYFVVSTDEWESFLYKRIDNEWKIVFIGEQTGIAGTGPITKISENQFIVHNSGERYGTDPSTWGGYIYIVTIENDRLEYKQITDIKEYYSSPAYGDITGDGLGDIITNSGWIFTQNQDGTFDPHNISSMDGSNYQDYTNYKNTFDLIELERFHELQNNLIQTTHDLYPGGRNEIIYAFIDVSDNVTEDAVVPRGDVLIYEYNESIGKYDIVYELPRRTVGEVEAVSDIEINDVNNDGINDIILSIVSGDSANETAQNPPIEIWIGKEDKTFYKHHEFSKLVDTMSLDMYDINHDGYLDIVLSPFGDSPDWIRNWCAADCSQRQENGESVKDGLLLHNAIYLNDGTGRFTKTEKEIIAEDSFSTWMYSFMRDGNLHFIGTVYNYIDGVTMDMETIEVEIRNYFD